MRVALYARVSTAEQAEHGLSVEAQLHALDEWAKGQTVVDHYVDLGVSARSPASKRPELQRMLKDCEAGKIDLIVFCKLDRFFRNVKEYYKVEDVLERSHVSWRAIQEDYETETAAGRLKVNIMLAVAQDEADRTSERIKAVFAEKKKKGEALSGKTSLGVSLVGKKLVPNDDAAKVQALFERYLSCRSIRQTVLAAPQIAGEAITYTRLSKMLCNRVYLDLGIVSPEVWNKAQDLRQGNSPRLPSTGRTYLFSGLCRCSVCGRKMSAHQNGENYAYYYCRKKALDGACTNSRSFSEKRIEKALLDNLMREVKAVNVQIKAKQRKPEDVSALRRRADKLTDLYLSDLIDRGKYEREFREIQARIEKAEHVSKQIDVQEVNGLLNIYKSFSQEARKAFWNRLLEEIVISPGGEISFALNITK